MIREIHIKNLALIEELNLEFEQGFTIFTGETGAGKSILIGAIGLLLGERASADMVRSGFDDAEVSGVFELETIKKPLQVLLDDLTISPENGQLIIRRKISRTDRNRILVNQVPVPLSSLKMIGNYLIDFHGQHEHQSLLNEEEHVRIVDNLPDVHDVRTAYDEAFRIYNHATQELAAHSKTALQLAEKQEILEFQNKELKSLQLRSGEEDELEQELSLLSSASERITCASEINSILGSGPDSFEKRIATIRKKLEILVKYDPAVTPWLNDVEIALATFTELETFCDSYLDKTGGGADPSKIEFINSRLAKIQRLKKKYNATLDQLIEKQRVIEKSLSSIENASSDIELLQKNVSRTLEKCLAAGKNLTLARKTSLISFDREISAIMMQLGFSGGKLTTVLDPVALPSTEGLEIVKFLVQTNTGEPFLPLAKTASGGEISRIMLAIKSVLADHDQIPVLIFDEIDTGIGGVLASEVGKVMRDLSKSHQLLCISHLHQIASLSNNHFKVYKETIADRTVTRVINLDKDEKIKEIARMLGGDSEISIKHARELVEQGMENREDKQDITSGTEIFSRI
jgi:DNA repair protein RecN (Recombination protein N)